MKSVARRMAVGRVGRAGRPARWLVALLAVALVSAACETGPPVDPLSTELIQRYRLGATGPTATATARVGRPDELPWALYLEASREIGLDFSSRTGHDVEIRTTPIAVAPRARLHVMVADGQLAGAWLSDDSVPGIYPLTRRP